MSGPVPLDHTSLPRPRRRWTRVQEAGLVIVILLLGAALTFLSEPIYTQGRVANNFLRLDNLESFLAPRAICKKIRWNYFGDNY